MALEHNEIAYGAAHLSSREKVDAAIASFQRERDVNVLLLPIKSGANGLNLTEAQHVIRATMPPQHTRAS